MDQQGQVSPDGKWTWDGTKWVAVAAVGPAGGQVSGGGGFIWRVPGFRTRTRWKMALASVGYLGGAWLAGLAILAVIAAAAGMGPATSPGASSPVAQVVASPTPSKQGVPANKAPLATTSPSLSASPSPKSSPSPSPSALAAAAVTPSSVPPPAPPPPPPPQNTCGAPANPWGYNFCGGKLIYSPPSSFCSYFNCIASFWKSTNGYVDECKDGTYSHSGGVQGACSYHGGELRPLYSP
jgi:hypothetical protein